MTSSEKMNLNHTILKQDCTTIIVHYKADTDLWKIFTFLIITQIFNFSRIGIYCLWRAESCKEVIMNTTDALTTFIDQLDAPVFPTLEYFNVSSTCEALKWTVDPRIQCPDCVNTNC